MVYIMFAVIKTGGKQYKVTEGQYLKVENVGGEVGDSVTFDQVLLTSDGDNIVVGKPFIDGTMVTAEVVNNGRAKKVVIIKFKRRQNYKRTKGHRQEYSEVQIKKINLAS
jgi:large subunit ribosomal protein L21